VEESRRDKSKRREKSRKGVEMTGDMEKKKRSE